MDKELAVTIGNAARQARKKLQLTQARVAEQLDVSVEFYSRIERGVTHPSTETFVRMLEVLAVSADTLLGVEPTREAAARSYAVSAADLPRDVRRLIAVLRTARPATLRLVNALLNELDRVSADQRRAPRAAPGSRSSAARTSPPEPPAHAKKPPRSGP